MTAARLVCLLLVLIASQAAADQDAEESCQTIHYQEGDVYSIKSALYKGTHITLPERLLFPPQAGNAALWTIQGNGHHIMIQPNSEKPQGAKTNIVLITESNTSYHFVLHRVDFNAAQSCVIIKNKAEFFQNAIKPEDGSMTSATYKTPCEKREPALQSEINALQQELVRLKTEVVQAQKLSDERINSVISKYRSMIYTRYEWSKGSGFKGRNLLTDVWDDGRFSYLRVRADHRGMLAITAEIDGRQEMLEYQVDSENIYKISGIYPELILVYDKKNKVKVVRRDKESNGVY